MPCKGDWGLAACFCSDAFMIERDSGGADLLRIRSGREVLGQDQLVLGREGRRRGPPESTFRSLSSVSFFTGRREHGLRPDSYR